MLKDMPLTSCRHTGTKLQRQLEEAHVTPVKLNSVPSICQNPVVRPHMVNSLSALISTVCVSGAWVLPLEWGEALGYPGRTWGKAPVTQH